MPALPWGILLQWLWPEGPLRTLQCRVSRRANTFMYSAQESRSTRGRLYCLEIMRVCSCIHGCRYYCVTRAQTPTPTDGLSGAPCPVSHFCPLGSRSPTPCPPGSYMPHIRGEKCHACPEGDYCVPGEKPQPCPQGELGSHLNAWFAFDFQRLPILICSFFSRVFLSQWHSSSTCLSGRVL